MRQCLSEAADKTIPSCCSDKSDDLSLAQVPKLAVIKPHCPGVTSHDEQCCCSNGGADQAGDDRMPPYLDGQRVSAICHQVKC